MPKKPNILLLFTDMQRADTIHALGNPVIRTPNLDRLVREGVAFTSCFTPSPVCISARCSLHYGLYPQRTGTYRNMAMMPDNGRSYPALLGEMGYRTHAIGKCHFAPDSYALRGFQSRTRQEEGGGDPEKNPYLAWLKERGYDWIEPHGVRGEMYYIPQVSTLPQEAHPTQWIGDRTIEFIREESGKGRPWCLFSSYIHPHPPFAPPKPWHKLYRAPLMPLPKVPQDSEALHTQINRIQNRYKYRDQGIDNNLVRVIKAYYYATISFIDYQIGRILAILEELGELDNTLIMFTSDHGEYLGDYNCFGKRSMHDASAKIPMIVRYPERFISGEICDLPTSLVDVLPTFLGAAGAEIDSEDFDGLDLAEIAAGNTTREHVFSQWSSGANGIYMVVDSRWKYFYSAADNREFLFDRVTDPDETRNKAGLVFCREARNRMKGILLAYLKKHGDESAYVEKDGRLEWREYPFAVGRDENLFSAMGVSPDPDAGLLVQDAPGSVVKIEGYSD